MHHHLVTTSILLIIGIVLVSEISAFDDGKKTKSKFPEPRGNTDESNKRSKPRARPIRSRLMTDIFIKCTDPEPDEDGFEDGTYCLNGKVLPNPDKLRLTFKFIEKTALWYSPENAPNVELIKKVQDACSPSCASGICFYSMKYLNFICGSVNSADYEEAQEDLYKVELAHFNYGLFPDGMICWTGDLNGYMYDSKKTNLADLRMSYWYETRVDDHDIFEVEKPLGIQCKSKKCELSYKKAAFICKADEKGKNYKSKSKSSGLRILPMSTSSTLLLLPFWTMIRLANT